MRRRRLYSRLVNLFLTCDATGVLAYKCLINSGLEPCEVIYAVKEGLLIEDNKEMYRLR